MAAVLHITLVEVTSSGCAKFVYAHPSLVEKSLTVRNPKVITQPRGSLCTLTVKQMQSGNRMLLQCTAVENLSSISSFVLANRERLLHAAWLSEIRLGISPRPEKEDLSHLFDGTGEHDKQYVHSKKFPYNATEEEKVVEVESDGFVDYGSMVMSEEIVNTLSAVKDLATDGASNILFIGRSGNGKTSLAREFATLNGMTFTKVNCSTVRDPEEWFGYREARDGSTVFVETDFTKQVKAGNAVILLDEINRLEPFLHNSLMPLLDETRETTVHGEDIKCGQNVVFFCTMNLGIGFVGTFMLDKALKNRMDATIVMPNLSEDREIALIRSRVSTLPKHDVVRIVRSLSKMRNAIEVHAIDVDVSNRSSLKIARLMATGKVDLNSAITLVIINSAEDAEQAKLLADSLV